MEKYTVGIYFDDQLKRIALILKNRPKWQEGRFNFPGGHIEENESGINCVIREFQEECGINTSINDWKEIGIILNEEFYEVKVFTAIQKIEHGEICTKEDQMVTWVDIDNLPTNIISNLYWLIPFAFNFWRQGNNDRLKFGIFRYEYPNLK
ncbi:MAG: NUDIX domain-containing protein [Candidatus Nanoarchaeia archaeon]|nr:NUDIX domain-containing protein [Candidatus Nanoarchaeia archaeon]